MMKKQLFLKLTCMVFVLLAYSGYAQNKNITGNVTDLSGIPLPGVNVIVKGTNKGAVTDFDGNYGITAATGSTLVFSYIGFTTKEVVVDSANSYNVNLEADNTQLDEVVVVGYGTQKRSDIINSVVSVDKEKLLRTPASDIGEMLKGRAPGVFVTTSDAGPGGSSNIVIRGRSSLEGGNGPLILVDGVPVGSINDVAAPNIANMEILKDAAAQAIYGARASNGVILITTKRAEEGVTTVRYNGFYGVQSINPNFELYSGPEFAQYKREAYRTTHNGEYGDDEDIFTAEELETIATGEYIDWMDVLFRVAPIQQHDISFSTGSEKSKVFFSLNYINQEGIVPETDYQKLTARINFDQKINDWLSIGANTSWALTKLNDPGAGGTLISAVTAQPLGQLYDDEGNLNLRPGGIQESSNPLVNLTEVTNLKRRHNDIMNLFIDVTPFKGFKYRFNLSRRSYRAKENSYNTLNSYAGIAQGASGTWRFPESREWQYENIFTYDLAKNRNNINLTFVQSQSDNESFQFNNSTTGFPNDILGTYGLESALVNTPSISGSDRGLLSFVLRGQYNYASKYYLNLSARSDASTVFGTNNKWAFFPAASIGWNIHKEAFMENSDAVNNLKLSFSYGSVGNQAIGAYGSLVIADNRDYLIDGGKASGYVAGKRLPNPNLKWETSTTFNAKLDYGFWMNRLSGTLEFYNTRTTDLLVEQSLISASGYDNRRTNLGEIENQGFEAGLNADLVRNDDLTIRTGFTFNTNRNKIISLYGIDEDGDGIEDDDVGNRWFIGRPINVGYSYVYDGIWQEGDDINQPDTEPGDIRVVDVNNDGIIDQDNDRVIQERDADWWGSFDLGIDYKNFDLSATFLTVQGRIINNQYRYNYGRGGSLRAVFNGIKQNYWTPENPSGNFPRPNEDEDPRYLSTLGPQDASYFRLTNLTLGYTLPKMASLKIDRLRIYGTAQNLFTITDYQSYSPEQDPGSYPGASTFVFGLQVTF